MVAPPYRTEGLPGSQLRYTTINAQTGWERGWSSGGEHLGAPPLAELPMMGIAGLFVIGLTLGRKGETPEHPQATCRTEGQRFN